MKGAKYLAASENRWYNSLSDPKISYMPTSSDISLQDSVSLSRQGCDQTNNDEIIPDLKPSRPRNPDDKGAFKELPQEKEKEKSKLQKWQEYTQPWIKPEGYDTGIKVYNSLTRQKEPLILPKGKVATWYDTLIYDILK